MTAKQYISLFYGSRERAITHLKKYVSLYENSNIRQTPKTIKRIEEYKQLLTEIEKL